MTANPRQLHAQTDSLFKVSGLKAHVMYIKRYNVEHKYREVADDYPLPNTNGSFNGDSFAIYTLDRGVRFGAEYDVSLSKIKRLKRFSTTVGIWYQSTQSETDFRATTKVNTNGFQLDYAAYYSRRILSLLALNYFYQNVRFAFGYNFNLFQKKRFEFTYRDNQVVSGIEGDPSRFPRYYSSIELPVLFKNKLLLRAVASYNRGGIVYAGIGLAYSLRPNRN